MLKTVKNLIEEERFSHGIVFGRKIEFERYIEGILWVYEYLWLWRLVRLSDG